MLDLPITVLTARCRICSAAVRLALETMLAQEPTLLARPLERSEVERSSLTLLERLLMLSSQLRWLLPEPEPLFCWDALPLLLLSEPRLHLKDSSEYHLPILL